MLHPTTEIGSVPHWAADHPHVRRARSMGANNTVYVASRRLELSAVVEHIPGAGVFSRLSNTLTLTARGKAAVVGDCHSGSIPRRGNRGSAISDVARWRRDNTACYLQTVGRGQEFVLNCDYFPEAFNSYRDIFANAA